MGGGVEYTRDYIASNPDDFIAVQIKASQPSSVGFTIHLDRGSSLNKWEAYSDPLDNKIILIDGSSDGVAGVDWSMTTTRFASSLGTDEL